jgi:polysaccharide biosynthesis transport protein
VTRLREAQDQVAVDTPDARIISHATVPARPSSPPRLIIFCASIPAGLLLGLLCALAMERMGYEAAPRARRGMVAEGFPVPVPVLGVVPDALAPWSADQIVSNPASPFAQMIFSIAARLAARSQVAQPRVVFVSGPERSEGHANIAVGLARALAMLQRKTVLIDADFAVAAAAQKMGLDRTRSGLLDVLSGAQPLSRAIARDPRSGALVMTSTAQPLNPAAVWAAEQTHDFLEHLRKTCDFVVIDAPADMDAPAIARLADAVLVVGTAGNARRLKSVAAALAGPGRRPVGIVLTR